MDERVVYYSSTCGGNLRVYAMMQEIASKGGNFCGVCPVIGRLNCPVLRLRISLRLEEGRLASAIFHGTE